MGEFDFVVMALGLGVEVGVLKVCRRVLVKLRLLFDGLLVTLQLGYPVLVVFLAVFLEVVRDNLLFLGRGAVGIFREEE